MGSQHSLSFGPDACRSLPERHRHARRSYARLYLLVGLANPRQHEPAGEIAQRAIISTCEFAEPLRLFPRQTKRNYFFEIYVAPSLVCHTSPRISRNSSLSTAVYSCPSSYTRTFVST